MTGTESRTEFPELCISPICSAQVLTSTEFPVDSIVVGLFRQLLIPNSIPQYWKSLPRNSFYFGPHAMNTELRIDLASEFRIHNSLQFTSAGRGVWGGLRPVD